MRLFKIINWIVGAVAAAAGLFVALGFVVGIVARSFLGIALFGVEELILMAVIWFYMLGAILASKDRAHLQADFIPVIVKNEQIIIVFRILATVISIGLAILFIMWSNELLQWALTRRQTTPVFSVPMYFSQVSLFTAATFMTLYLIRDLITDIQALRGKPGSIKET